ncbi:MAG: DUF4296 domain-containing protein [Alistipes sp.]|nr:DUF4296 domain-containing protein [Alistipes sp.]
MKLKHIFTTLLIAATAIMTACNRPKVIPDKELGAIFRDAVLVNAYLMINNGTNIDSLRIYEPIFARHGYTAEDVQYTIHNFSRRKSANLSDVAEYMILLLDREANALNLQVAKLDTIENAARRHYTKTLLAESDIRVTKEADSARLRFVVEPVYAGTYDVRANYTLDSLDKAAGRRYRLYFERPDSSIRAIANGMIQRRKGANFDHRYDITPEDNYTRLVLEMSHFSDPKQRAATRMHIHDVTIRHTPPTEECVDMLFKEQSGVRIFSDSLIRAIEEGARE